MRRADMDANEPVCCCGCGNSTSPLHFDHSTPTFEDEVVGTKWATRGPAPVAGPDALKVVHEESEASSPDNSLWDQAVRGLPVGKMVKLCFLVNDKQFHWLPSWMRREAQRFECEPMWVKITAAGGSSPDVTYKGDLYNVPVFISPKKLQWGSSVSFAPEHIQMLETE